jgi:outer membrane lipase/esterase
MAANSSFIGGLVASMRMKQACFAAAVLLSLTQLAQAQNFNQLIGFGDSATDTGWFTGATSGPHSTGVTPFDLSIAAALAAGGNGHWTGPGQGNAQILAGFFGLSANAVGTPGGTNFAIGNDVDFLVPPGFIPATATGNLFPNPLLPGTATQINNYLASVGGHANPNAIYLLSSGGNDITAALQVFGAFSPAGVAYLLGEAQALTNSLASLQAAGARYIIMSNYYPGPVNIPAGTFYGDTILSATWRDLAAAGVKFIPADTISVFAVVEQHFTEFGFTHDPHAFLPANYACLPPTGSGLLSGYGILCAPGTTPSSTHGYMQSADATQTYLFMDGVHLTAAGQQIEADYIYSLLAAPSEISFLAEAPLKTRDVVIDSIRNQIPLSFGTAGTFHGWVTGDVSWLKMTNGIAGLPDDPGTPLATTAGFDYAITPDWLVGAAFSAGFTEQSFSLGGNFKQTEFAISLYTAFRKDAFWFDAIATWGSISDDVNRQIPLGITTQSNQGSTTGSNVSLAAETGYNFRTAVGTLPSAVAMPLKAALAAPLYLTHGPVIGVIAQQVHIDAFAETNFNVPTNLAFASQLRNSAVSELGYQASLTISMWEPYVRAVWDHEFDGSGRLVTASLLSIVAPSYSLPAVALGTDWGSVILGTRLKFAPNATAFAALSSQIGQGNVTTYGGQIGINVAFQPPGVVARY